MTPLHDWERLARVQPYWAVLTDQSYRSDVMDSDRLAEFYASGVAQVKSIVEQMRVHLGVAPAGGRALDVGCGVGRLTRAMRTHADSVTGYDVSPTMLSHARQHAISDGIDYVNELPNGYFDWINSFIVFQHIPPARGLQLLSRVLDLAAPEAFASIQITCWSDSKPLSLWLRFRRAAQILKARLGLARADGLLSMHAYDFGEVARVFVERGFDTLHLSHTDHGGQHGFWIYARRGQ